MFQISTEANYNHPEKGVHSDVLLHKEAVLGYIEIAN